MNGYIVISLRNGMMIAGESFYLNFGLRKHIDPMQQSGFLYTLYMASTGISSGSEFSNYNSLNTPVSTMQSPLTWIVEVCLLF